MVEREDLKKGGRYTYQDKGMSGPAVVVVEEIANGTVRAREEGSQVSQTWEVDTFAQNATAVSG